VNSPAVSVSRPVGEHFAALAALRDAGLVRFLGLSNVTAGQIDEALAIAPVVAAGPAGLDPGAGKPRAGDPRNR
jgi:pyridoxine 4-dehydrogenase